MKKLLNWKSAHGLLLVTLSAVVYYIHFLIFKDVHHIILYLIRDIAFVFLEVLLVTMIIHGLLVYREKQTILRKLNMVLGTFFSEAGTELLKSFCKNTKKGGYYAGIRDAFFRIGKGQKTNQ